MSTKIPKKRAPTGLRARIDELEKQLAILAEALHSKLERAYGELDVRLQDVEQAL